MCCHFHLPLTFWPYLRVLSQLGSQGPRLQNPQPQRERFPLFHPRLRKLTDWSAFQSPVWLPRACIGPLTVYPLTTHFCGNVGTIAAFDLWAPGADGCIFEVHQSPRRSDVWAGGACSSARFGSHIPTWVHPQLTSDHSMDWERVHGCCLWFARVWCGWLYIYGSAEHKLGRFFRFFLVCPKSPIRASYAHMGPPGVYPWPLISVETLARLLRLIFERAKGSTFRIWWHYEGKWRVHLPTHVSENGGCLVTRNWEPKFCY